MTNKYIEYLPTTEVSGKRNIEEPYNITKKPEFKSSGIDG